MDSSLWQWWRITIGASIVGALLIGMSVALAGHDNNDGFCEECDVDGSGAITLRDVAIVRDHVGERRVTPAPTLTPAPSTSTSTSTSTAVPTATSTPSTGACAGDCGTPRDFCAVSGPWAFCNDYRQLGATGVEVPFPPATEPVSFDCLDATDPGYLPHMLAGTLPFPCAFSKYEHFMTRMESGSFGIAIMRIKQPFSFAGRTGHIHVDFDNKGRTRNYVRLMVSPDLTKRISDDRGGDARYPLTFLEAWFRNGSVEGTICRNGACDGDSYPYGDAFGSGWPDELGTDNVRAPFDVFISRTHIKIVRDLGLPTERVFVDEDIPDLGFDVGYVYLSQASYNPCKDGQCSIAEQIFHWDNVAFDGPALPVDGLTPVGMQDVVFNAYGAASCTVAGVPARRMSGHVTSYTWQTWVARMPVQGVLPSDATCTDGGGHGFNTGKMGFEIVRQ